MKKIVFLFILIFGSRGLKAQDTLKFESRLEASAFFYEQLTPALYGYALLDRSFSSHEYIHQQIKGNYNQVYDAYSWMQMYSDLSLAYTDTLLMKSIPGMGRIISDYFFLADMEEERLIQPFTLMLHQVSMIDSVRYYDGSLQVIDNQVVPTVSEAGLYSKRLIKCVSVFEMDPANGFPEGVMVYNPAFISTSPDIEIQNISIDVGNGFETFGVANPMITYSRMVDSAIAYAAIEYLLVDSLIYDTLAFYLVTDGNVHETEMSRSIERWDAKYDYHGEKMDFSVGIKFACGNQHGLSELKRPVIFVPPYRPSAQFYVTLNTYWDQFGFKSLFLHLSEMGYDVIFLKEHSGHESIELAGEELARFINEINEIKFSNYPDEAWENVLVGYSAGGQHSRYALMYLEKEHMDHGGPHHHTRLYIPFDSPHLGGNVPMFTQSVYKDFSNESLVAWMPWESLNDDASTDMLFWHYNGSNITEVNDPFASLVKTISPAPHDNRIALTDRFVNDFTHSFTHAGDLRRTYPTFTRNVAIATGSYKNTYEDEYGLTSGMLLFKQNGVGLPTVPPSISFINRQLYSSDYSTTESPLVFKRKDTYFTLGVIPWQVDKEYRTNGAWEWDNAQGGYKTEFYQGMFTGAAYILRSNSLFLSGQRLYDDETMFMPLVSALGIDPDIWWNNHLYYNLQDQKLMRQAFDPVVPQSELFGYPHLEYPTTHFQITPFEALYADKYTYDHIKMQESVTEYNLDDTYLVYLRNFICDEVEGESVYLQNKVIGDNHVIDPNYEYRAWYKARNTIYFGEKVSPKTDVGDYIIESTGDITAYAGHAVMLMPGFHAQAGSNFYAYIDISDCDAAYGGRSAADRPWGHATQSYQDHPVQFKVNTAATNHTLDVYPNPTNGLLTIEIKGYDPGNRNYQMLLYNALGGQLQQVDITGARSMIDLSGYQNGMYILSFTDGESTQVIRVSKTN